MRDEPLRGKRRVPIDEVERIDRELFALGRGYGAARLRLGELLEAIAAGELFHRLGFSTFEAYALERCERGPRFADDSRVLARRLANLPHLRAALRAGRISWSMAEICARHATPETEADLLEQALGSTVRGMRKRLAEPPDEEPDLRRTLERRLPIEDVWAVERTRILLDTAFGLHSDDALVEVMIAEGLVSLQILTNDRWGTELVLDPRTDSDRKAFRALLAGWREEAEADAEDAIPPAPVRDADPAPEGPLPRDAHALDLLARKAAQDLARRDLEMGDLARALFDANGWRRLGYASEQQYVRERVGVSHSTLKDRMTLSRRAESMPAIRDAVTAGRIGFEAAQLVARVADPGTAATWIDRAERRTIKHLREEVRAVEMATRMDAGEPCTYVPPSEDEMKAVEDLRRRVLRGDLGQMSGRASTARREGLLRLRVREDLYEAFRALEDQYRRSGLPWSFVSFLCQTVWESWWHELGDPDVAYAHIYERDGWRCRCPVCLDRHVQPHHLVYRSRGGDDSDENLASVSDWCHLDGIHAGLLSADGPASCIRWRIGNPPILEVVGREAKKWEVTRE
jgi:hypothetical protein